MTSAAQEIPSSPLRVGLLLDEEGYCCAQTLDGATFTMRHESYRKAIGQLHRLLNAHHGRPVTLTCTLLLPDTLQRRLEDLATKRGECERAVSLVREESAKLARELAARKLNTASVAKLMSISPAQVTNLQRTETLRNPGRRPRRQPRVPARMRVLPNSRVVPE